MWFVDLYVFILQPEIIGSLPSLQELWLDCNELQDLPPVSHLVS